MCSSARCVWICFAPECHPVAKISLAFYVLLLDHRFPLLLVETIFSQHYWQPVCSWLDQEEETADLLLGWQHNAFLQRGFVEKVIPVLRRLIQILGAHKMQHLCGKENKVPWLQHFQQRMEPATQKPGACPLFYPLSHFQALLGRRCYTNNALCIAAQCLYDGLTLKLGEKAKSCRQKRRALYVHPCA